MLDRKMECMSGTAAHVW